MTSQKAKISNLLNLFEDTIDTNLKRATKEVWVISDHIPRAYKNSNFIVRYLLREKNDNSTIAQQPKANRILFFAKRDFRVIPLSGKIPILKQALPKIAVEWLKILLF